MDKRLLIRSSLWLKRICENNLVWLTESEQWLDSSACWTWSVQVFVCVFCNKSGLKALSIYFKFRRCVFFKLSSCNFNFTLETTPELRFCFHPLSCLEKVIWPQLCFCYIIYMLQLYLPSMSCRGSAETIIHFSEIQIKALNLPSQTLTQVKPVNLVSSVWSTNTIEANWPASLCCIHISALIVC